MLWIIHQQFDPQFECHHNNTSKLAVCVSVALQGKKLAIITRSNVDFVVIIITIQSYIHYLVTTA